MEERILVTLRDLPFTVQSYLIFFGATLDSYEPLDADIIEKGIEKLCRNQPSLLTKCNEYLNTL